MRSFIIFSLIIVLLTSGGISIGQAQTKEANRLKSSATVLNEIMATPDKSIPEDLLTQVCLCGHHPIHEKGWVHFRRPLWAWRGELPQERRNR